MIETAVSRSTKEQYKMSLFTTLVGGEGWRLGDFLGESLRGEVGETVGGWTKV